MLSYWHVHADDYSRQVQEHEETQIAAVWDEEPARGREQASRYGVPFYESLDELLNSGGIDAVVVDAPTNLHRDVMIRAARAGKHIFTEKVVAATYAEVREILDAVREAGVRLTVSLPRLYDGYTEAIERVLREGALGRLTMARARLSHNGATAGWLPPHFFSLEQCRGGALIDLGCHPMYLVRRFLGVPESVSAAYGYVTGKEVEDNAVAVLQYADGAIGIVEAGFVNSHSPFSVELHGTDGTLLFGFPEQRMLLRSDRRGGGWETVELPPGRPTAFRQWVDHIRRGTDAEDNVAMAVDLTRLMEAANRSAAENRPVRLNELA
jgi:predicted dehydrogenase